MFLSLSDLGGAFGGVVESGASQEEVDLLPGLTARLFQMQEALNLRTRPRLQQVLKSRGIIISKQLFIFLSVVYMKLQCWILIINEG